jgi:hypothetical protein
MLRHAWSRNYNYCTCGALGDGAGALSLRTETHRTIAGGERTLKSGPTALCGGYKPGPRNAEETLDQLIRIIDDRELHDAVIELLETEGREPTLAPS